MKRKLALVSLGCDKNRVDSENILALFKDEFELVENKKDADLIIINTCGFILAAKKEAINEILDSIKYNAKVVVTGCLSSRYKEELVKEIPEVSLFFRFDEYDSMKGKVMELFNEKANEKFSLYERVLTTLPYMAYLKIAEGCSNFCGFCAIPYIRGKFHSFNLNDLVNEAKRLTSLGIKELCLIAQDTGKYGIDLKNGTTLLSLLKELEKIELLEHIRLFYMYPETLNEELLDYISKSKKIYHYFDIPIQHASNKILKSMLRKDTKEDLIRLYNSIKSKMDDAILRTTILVGYPGEKDEDFNELLEFIEKYPFNHLGCFTYSPEEKTYGYFLKDQVEEEVKIKRKEILMLKQKEISKKLNEKLIGKTFTGYINFIDNNQYFLETYYNFDNELDGSISFYSNKKYSIGEKINVKIVKSNEYDLFGEEIING